WSGLVFAGVGSGVAFAGLFGLLAGLDGWGSRVSWIALGLIAVALAALLWAPLQDRSRAGSTGVAQRHALPGRAILAAVCYLAFGYGYIIPATFLPALARGYIDNPATFGLIWPVFGIAAAVSTLAASRLGRGLAPWQLWTRAQWLLAVG